MSGEREASIAALRKWADECAEHVSATQAFYGLHSAMRCLLEEFCKKHEVSGVRYFERYRSDGIRAWHVKLPSEAFLVDFDTGEAIELQHASCAELTRDEWLARQGIHFGYDDDSL